MSAPSQRPRNTFPHYRCGDPLVCQGCRAPTAQGSGGRAQLSPEEFNRLQQYLPHAQEQGQHDLQALEHQRLDPGAAWNDDRSITTGLLRSSNPSQLPHTYPYPVYIDIAESPPTWSSPRRPVIDQAVPPRLNVMLRDGPDGPVSRNRPANTQLYRQSGNSNQTVQMRSGDQTNGQRRQPGRSYTGAVLLSTMAIAMAPTTSNADEDDDGDDG